MSYLIKCDVVEKVLCPTLHSPVSGMLHIQCNSFLKENQPDQRHANHINAKNIFGEKGVWFNTQRIS